VDLNGSWQVTSATNSVILSIEPGGRALIIMMKSGSFSTARAKWRPLPGGVLVESFPRFRLWPGPDNSRLRAERELPGFTEASDTGWSEFPQAFFMRRIEEAQIPDLLRNIPLPAGWEKPALDKTWDQKAGQRRSLVPIDAKNLHFVPR
jgi:hypothetical protein